MLLRPRAATENAAVAINANDRRRREHLYQNNGQRNCGRQSSQCIYTRRDTHEQCKMCTRDVSRYCWQHRFNPSLREFDPMTNVIHINQGIIDEVTNNQNLAPAIVDNLANGYGEFFISFVLRKIKDQCRHIEIPITTNISVVKVNVTMNTMGPQWRPFITYVRCMHARTMMHFVLTNFFRHPVDNRNNQQRRRLTDPINYNITVWSPQFTFMQDPRQACQIMHDLFNPQIGNNVSQIFNCFVNRDAIINYVPVYSIYDSLYNMHEKYPADTSRFATADSTYVLECLCMVKYLVLQIQKYQRTEMQAARQPIARAPRRLNPWRPRRRVRSRAATQATAIVPVQAGVDNRPYPNEMCGIFFFDYDSFLISLGFVYDPATKTYRANHVQQQQGGQNYRDSYRVVIMGEPIFNHLVRQGTEQVGATLKALFSHIANIFYTPTTSNRPGANPNEQLTIRPDPSVRPLGEEVDCNRETYEIFTQLREILSVLFAANNINVWSGTVSAVNDLTTNNTVDQQLINHTQFPALVRLFLGQDVYDRLLESLNMQLDDLDQVRPSTSAAARARDLDQQEEEQLDITDEDFASAAFSTLDVDALESLLNQNIVIDDNAADNGDNTARPPRQPSAPPAAAVVDNEYAPFGDLLEDDNFFNLTN